MSKHGLFSFLLLFLLLLPSIICHYPSTSLFPRVPSLLPLPLYICTTCTLHYMDAGNQLLPSAQSPQHEQTPCLNLNALTCTKKSGQYRRHTGPYVRSPSISPHAFVASFHPITAFNPTQPTVLLTFCHLYCIPVPKSSAFELISSLGPRSASTGCIPTRPMSPWLRLHLPKTA